MKIKPTKEQDYQDWKDKNTDPYGAACFEYAERWADLMEQEIKNGKTLKDFAEETSQKADTEGITGFMYGVAVKILSEAWIHGEDLRQWHNGKYGHGGDGVVNPAIITI